MGVNGGLYTKSLAATQLDKVTPENEAALRRYGDQCGRPWPLVFYFPYQFPALPTFPIRSHCSMHLTKHLYLTFHQGEVLFIHLLIHSHHSQLSIGGKERGETLYLSDLSLYPYLNKHNISNSTYDDCGTDIYSIIFSWCLLVASTITKVILK